MEVSAENLQPQPTELPIVFTGDAARLIARLAEEHNMDPTQVALGLLSVGGKVLVDLENGHRVGRSRPVHGSMEYMFTRDVENYPPFLPFAAAQAKNKQ